ncbi:MAG: presenilin family intramembrane aspartyl protease [Dehalococcoidia bacterium]|nr:presenilin family intramembrane aspartyl protease [Dehalococcoidia bacterium]
MFAQCVMFAITPRIEPFLNDNDIYVPPQPPSDQIIFIPSPPTTSPGGDYIPEVPAPSSLLPIILYFAGLIIVISLILFFIPLSALKFVFRSIFALLFAWGIFILCVFYLPNLFVHILGDGEAILNIFGRSYVLGPRYIPNVIGIVLSAIIGLTVGINWLFKPRMWLHNLALLIAVASMASIFGRFLSPWTAMILLGALAIYDILAVRFGFMMWMANKMSQGSALPAFVLPTQISDLNTKIQHVELSEVAETKTDERDFSLLGGGDIAFPLLLTASVFLARGLRSALLVALLCLSGVGLAYLIQSKVLKGKPMPAIPPIAFMGLISMLMVFVLFKSL